MDAERSSHPAVSFPREPAAAPTVSIILPHYRDFRRLDLCLAALGRQTFPAENLEIIVADNASPEGEALLKTTIAGRARWVIIEEKGAGTARNGGAAIAQGSILAFTDSDCVPEPEWLAEGIAALASSDFVGGRMKVLVEDPAHMTPSEAFESVFAFDNETYVKRKGFTVTANLICPRAVFDRVGGFLAAGVSEDAEWAYRARDAGFCIGYAPASVVGHPARKDWNELLKKWRRANSDNYGLARMQRGGRLHWFLRSLLVPVSAVAHSPRALFSKKVTSFGQHIGALGILFRLRFWRFFDSMRLLANDRTH